ncbi:MAG: ABC transporter substrate-binding protein [Gemmataceae bacterium]
MRPSGTSLPAVSGGASARGWRLVLAWALLVGWAVHGAPIQEVEEKEPPKPKKLIIDEEPNFQTTAPPTARSATDLAKEAEKATHPAVKDLFQSLQEPHDRLIRSNGSTTNVAPFSLLWNKETFPDTIRVIPFDKSWKPENSVPISKNAIARIEPYEDIALSKVNDFLTGNVNLSRLELTRQAEKVLVTVLRFHQAQRELNKRSGSSWDQVQQRLQDRLRDVQLEQLRVFLETRSWDDAWLLAERLRETYPDQPAVGQAIVHARLAYLEQVELAKGRDADYLRVRELLEQLEADFPGQMTAGSNRRLAEALRLRLENRARELWRLADKDAAAAGALLHTAENIAPWLPGLREYRVKKLQQSPLILYVGVSHLPQYLSPALAATDSERHAVELLFQSLIKPVYDPRVGQQYRPDLTVGRPRLVPLGRQFQLTSEARWSNGDLVTADDVRETVARLRNARGLGAVPEWASLVEPARVRDPFRLELNLQRGYFDPLSLMTFKVLPAAHLKSIDDIAFARQPIGSGPFYFPAEGGRAQEGSPPRQYVRFLANPFYRDHSGRRDLPHIQEIRFVRSVDPRAEFKSGQLHLLLDVSTPRVEEIESDAAGLRDEVKVHTLPNRRVYFLAVNHRVRWLQDTDLRRAIAHAIDRDKILTEFFRGTKGQQVHRWLNGPFPVGSWPCHPNLKQNPFQPSLAQSLARKAKANLGGKKLTLKYARSAGPDGQDDLQPALTALADQVRALTGVDIELVPCTPWELRQAVEVRHDYDLAYYHWDYTGEDYWLWPLFDPAGMEPGGRNFLGYGHDGELQSCFRRWLDHRRFEDVQTMAREVHSQVYAKMPLIPLWQLDTHIAVHRHLKTVPEPNQLDPLRMFTDVAEWQLRR